METAVPGGYKRNRPESLHINIQEIQEIEICGSQMDGKIMK